MSIDVARIEQARALLAQHFDRTPLVRAESLSTPDCAVFLKNETVLPTGSFKVRGAVHALSANLERGLLREVVAASTGNHGAAVAFAGRSQVCRRASFRAIRIRSLRDSRAGRDHRGGGHRPVPRSTRRRLRGAHGAFCTMLRSDIPAGTLRLRGNPSSCRRGRRVPMGDTLIRGVASASEWSREVSSGRRRGRTALPPGGPARSSKPIRQTIADGLPCAVCWRRTSGDSATADDAVTVNEREMMDAIASCTPARTSR
jgi:hypothetical protein